MTSAPTNQDERKKLATRLSDKKTVILLIALYLVLRLPWLLTLPVTEAPDEPNHFWVVHFIAQHWAFPTFQDVHTTGPAAEYGALPPLGYIPHVILTALAPETLKPLFSRMGSLLIGAVVPIIALFLGKLLFPAQRFLALALPLLAIVHPQLVFVNSYTNNDSMATALSSLIIYLIVRGIWHGLPLSTTALIGASFGILGLSKHTGLSVAPAVVLGIVAAGLANALAPLQILARIMVFGAGFALSSFWYFIRNYFEFKGDILGTKTMYESWITILPKVNGAVQHPWPQVTKLSWWRYVMFDYVGLFGYMDRYLWRPTYFAFLGYLIAALVGWLRPEKGQAGLSSVEKTKFFWTWIIVLAFPMCNLLANLAATIFNVTGPHGRYLFPSELCILALVIAGLAKLKFSKQIIVSLLILNLVVTEAVWFCWYMPGPHL